MDVVTSDFEKDIDRGKYDVRFNTWLQEAEWTFDNLLLYLF